MAANWRIAMFGLANLFLTTHRAFQSTEIAINPTELQIYLTVAVANVQKLMRERQIPEQFSGTDILPREWVVPISRNAIASATGLPRETVRRQVEKMIERGLLVEDPRGGVTPPIGMVEKLGIAPILEPIMIEFTRTAEMLIRLGVIDREEY
ncbi:MAG: hypothetical protein C0500_08280 [Sphingobium sp.]|nr:hypothetical protein [Sphingobium sp.]